MRKEYKFKYIGENNKSGYERGKEHLGQKENIDEGSHMLKHCLLEHPNLRPNEVKFGMRLRGQFKTPIERQIGEATAILIDSKKGGISLLNSKSEFNRCSLPRITAGTHKEILDEMTEETEEEKRIRVDIRCMRKRRKEERQEEKKRKMELDRNKRRKVEMAIPETISENEVTEEANSERRNGAVPSELD